MRIINYVTLDGRCHVIAHQRSVQDSFIPESLNLGSALRTTARMRENIESISTASLEDYVRPEFITRCMAGIISFLPLPFRIARNRRRLQRPLHIIAADEVRHTNIESEASAFSIDGLYPCWLTKYPIILLN
eukprot:UN17274